MKHYFIQQKHLPRLTLFFAGWGMDECPFMDYCPENSDLLVCYDYHSLDFDFTLLQGYQEIRLIAWSMGVCGKVYPQDVFEKGESGNILVETSATCGRGTARRASEDWRTGKILRCSQFCMGTGCYRQE